MVASSAQETVARRFCLHCGLLGDGARSAPSAAPAARPSTALLRDERPRRLLRSPRRARRAGRRPARRAAAIASGWSHSRSGSAPSPITRGSRSTCRVCTASAACGSSKSSSRAHAGGERVVVNPALGRVDMVVRPDFDLHAFVSGVERFGYLFGPPLKSDPRASRDLLWRLGVCVAIAMNSMIFAIAALRRARSQGRSSRCSRR